MADTTKAPSEESFEFIETPPAHTPLPAENYGVRTTSVSTTHPPSRAIGCPNPVHR